MHSFRFAFFVINSAAARGIVNRRGVGKVRHLSCRCLWLQERMADGSMIVSPVSGLKNPADIGTKGLNVHRMKALMFLLGMFDSVNNCQVGGAEAHTIVHQQEVKRAMQSVRRLVKSDDTTLKALVLMNALGLARGQHGALQSTGLGSVSWWTAVICTAMAIAISGWYVYSVRRVANEPNVEINQEKKSKVSLKRISADVVCLRACQRLQTLTCGWLYTITQMAARVKLQTRLRRTKFQNGCLVLWIKVPRH